jgi:hypothetical protein
MEDGKQAPDTESAERAAAKERCREGGRQVGRKNLLAFNESRGGRPALTHGVNATIASGGEIPATVPGAEEISAAAEEIIKQTVFDLGYQTESEMPAQKRCLLSAQRLCLKILMLADRFITAEGLVIKGRANPLLTVAATYINSMRLNAEKLGLERRSKSVEMTLEQVLAEHADEAQKEAVSDAD